MMGPKGDRVSASLSPSQCTATPALSTFVTIYAIGGCVQSFTLLIKTDNEANPPTFPGRDSGDTMATPVPKVLRVLW